MKWFYGLYPTDRIKIDNKFYYISNFFPHIKILFSIWPLFSKCRSYWTKIQKSSFKEVFSIPNETEVIADSGAFGYYRSKNQINKLWDLKTILKIYDVINPNFGVHNDIPVSFLNRKKIEDNNKLLLKNLDNAKKFIKLIKKKNYFPIAVAQGKTESDYVNQIQELYHFGYNYIGIGGIAYLGSKHINSILSSVFLKADIRKLDLKIHIFGVGRYNILRKYPIHSFDNTSPLNDSHRDKIGKRTYYYTIDKKRNTIIKRSLIELQQSNFKIDCKCIICQKIGNDILLTGKAYRNHSRAFHNAFIYNKIINNINECKNN